MVTQPNPRLQLGLQQITLVQKQHHVHFLEELVRDHRFPEDDGIFEAVRGGVLGKKSVSDQREERALERVR
jgi:hypothetical protein